MTGLGLEHMNVDTPGEPSGASSSTLARIRSLYQRAADDQHLDLAIPRTSIMGVRYGPLDEFESTGKTARDRNLDFLIAACKCILVREGDGWEPLIHDGEFVRFDEQLSDIAGLGVPSVEDGGTAREVVLRVFRRAPVPHAAIALQVDRLSDWMAGETGVDEEDLLGES